ncbi:MAG TPA: magnesium transporter CorA family protein [Rhizomicrobium sp.]|jgi:magnesium transporter|nr:magnesium transporter CorA family protein [Rhizomicrobium sp.]
MRTDYPAQGRAVWIDLVDPSDADVANACSDYKIAIPTRSQLEEIESSSRLRAEAGTLIMSMPLTPRPPSGGEPVTAPVGLIVSSDLFVTIRYAEIRAFTSVKERLAKGEDHLTPPDIFVTLLEAMVDAAADRLEETKTQLDEVSRRVFKRYGRTRQRNSARSNQALKEILVQVGEAGDRTSQMRETLLGVQRIIPFAADKGHKWLSEAELARLKTAAQDIQSLSDFEVHLSNKVQFLLDAVLGFINTEQNDIFKVLTIVSVVGIPPTLIASMYGMNFQTMPEYHWHYGYAYGLTLIVLSTVLPMIWFKWRGWW